jgi:hypothetical protein
MAEPDAIVAFQVFNMKVAISFEKVIYRENQWYQAPPHAMTLHSELIAFGLRVQ